MKARPQTLAACLIFLLMLALQWSFHSKLIWFGYPYEEWDEIGSSNNAAVLDEPETLRAYSYGSLDSFLHIIAHFYYQKYDDLGKRHQRHSFANNVSQSLNDPFYVYGPKADPNALDYNYFRGLNDREVIFQARKLYILVVYALLAIIGLTAILTLGGAGLGIGFCLLLLSSGPLFVTQAAYALPNAINSLLAVFVMLTSYLAVSRGERRWLFVASALTAAGTNMKIDFASMALVLALVGLLTWSRARWSWRELLINGAASVGSFFGVFILTRPMILVRPLGEWAVQYNTLSNVVSSSVDRIGNWHKLPAYLASEILNASLPQYSYFAEIAPIVFGTLTLVCLILYAASAGRILSQWRECLIFLVAVSLLWWVPISRSVQLYPRYFLYGSSVWWLFVGVVLVAGFRSTLRISRYGVFALCLVLLALYCGRFYDLFARQSAMSANYAKLAGLDPAQTRNRISFEAVNLIEQGKFAREIFVDQHSYTDLRFFWIHNIQTRYINMINFEAEFAAEFTAQNTAGPGAAAEQKPRLVLFAPADGGGGEDLLKYNRYREFLLKLPVVSHIPGNTMSTLSPAPIVPTDEVMLLKYSLGLSKSE